MENINGLKSVYPICVMSHQLLRNNASRDLYTHAQKQCEKGLLIKCTRSTLRRLEKKERGLGRGAVVSGVSVSQTVTVTYTSGMSLSSINQALGIKSSR